MVDLDYEHLGIYLFDDEIENNIDSHEEGSLKDEISILTELCTTNAKEKVKLENEIKSFKERYPDTDTEELASLIKAYKDISGSCLDFDDTKGEGKSEEKKDDNEERDSKNEGEGKSEEEKDDDEEEGATENDGEGNGEEENDDNEEWAFENEGNEDEGKGDEETNDDDEGDSENKSTEGGKSSDEETYTNKEKNNDKAGGTSEKDINEGEAKGDEEKDGASEKQGNEGFPAEQSPDSSEDSWIKDVVSHADTVVAVLKSTLKSVVEPKKEDVIEDGPSFKLLSQESTSTTKNEEEDDEKDRMETGSVEERGAVEIEGNQDKDGGAYENPNSSEAGWINDIVDYAESVEANLKRTVKNEVSSSKLLSQQSPSTPKMNKRIVKVKRKPRKKRQQRRMLLSKNKRNKV